MYNSAAGSAPTAAGSGGNWTNSWGPLTNSGSAGSSEYCRSNFYLFIYTHTYLPTSSAQQFSLLKIHPKIAIYIQKILI